MAKVEADLAHWDGPSDDEEHAPLVEPSLKVSGMKQEEAGDSSSAAPDRLPPWWRKPAVAFWNNGIACVLGSSFTFSLASAIVKVVQDDIPVFQIVLIRAVFSSGVTSLTCRTQGIPIFGHAAPLPLKVARGAIGATAMVLTYESIVRLPLADSTVIFFLSPAFTALLGWLLLGEKFGWLTAAGCTASLAGVVVVAQPGSAAVGWSHQRLLGMAFGFASAVLAAGAYVCIRQIGKREHPLTIAMYFHVFSFLFSVLPLSAGYPEPAVLPSPGQAVLLLIVAACSFTANLLVNRAFQVELAAKASAVNFSQVIFAWTLGFLFFGDPLTLLGVCGTALIAAGVIAVNLDKMTQQKQQLGAGLKVDAPPLQAPVEGSTAAGAGQQSGRAAGWWRRLLGWRQQPAAEEEQLPIVDHRGRLKFKSSFKSTEPGLLFVHNSSGSASAELIPTNVPHPEQGSGSVAFRTLNPESPLH